MKNIPDAQKIFELSTIWKEAAYNFAFWDKAAVDWDAEYRAALPRVLMNQHTFSAAEDFVDVMKAYTSAVFIGNNTAGTSGQPLCVPLESGGFFRICTRRCLAQNGEDIYNRGFAPDVRVIPTAEDVAAGRDAALETGLAHLRHSLRPPQTNA